MRQRAQKADGVREQKIDAVDGKTPRRRVERRKEAVFRSHFCAGQQVQEGRFTRIRIADKGDPARRFLYAARVDEFSPVFEDAQTVFQIGDAHADAPSVRFQLGFTGTARADTAAKP